MDRMTRTQRLPFFPALLPDESLHSWVSRFHRLSGNPEERQTLHDIFGTHLLVATANLPSHLPALCAVLPANAWLSVDQLIDQSTLLPYFRPFLKLEQAEHCRKAMVSANASGMKIAIGLVASRIGGRNAFRYCSQCCAEDEQIFGSAYWHRTHSLPGVLLCHRHRTVLAELKTEFAQLRRHNLFLPTDSWVCEESTAVLKSGTPVEDLLQLAASSADLLAASMPPLPAPLLRSFYREQAARQGWIDHHGRIQSAAIIHVASRSSLGQAGDCDLAFCRQPQWIFKLLYKHRTAMHPLKHLALLVLLGTTPQALCAYSRCAAPGLTDGAEAHRVWKADSGLDAAQAGARRQRFLGQLKDIPARCIQDYMWLYRHDRRWLQQAIAQAAKPRKPVQGRLSWDQRDRQFAEQIRQHAVLLYQSDLRTRISASCLARATGRQALIEKFSGKLPMTIQAIQGLAETVESFQCRRLRRVVQDMQVKGESLIRWRILRIAGLVAPLAPQLEKELATLLSSEITP